MKPIKIIITVVLVLVVSVCAFLALRSDGSSDKSRKVILISIDTCRADRLSCYGYKSNTTPHLDRLTKDGALFLNTISPAPITFPAHSTMLTGAIPPGHGVRNNIGYQMSPSNTTLAEHLKANGFSTAAVISSFVLDSTFGMDQGFDVYDDEFDMAMDSAFGAERLGEEATDHAIELIDKHRDQDSFLFLHYYDPHVNYAPPEPFATKFKDDLYAGEIAYVDNCIGRLIDHLKKQGLYKSTMIIVAGDHGEMLGEHEELTHTYFIYQSAVKVPMIIKPPGKAKSQTFEGLAGLVDIVPTICGMYGIEPPEQSRGHDLSDSVKTGTDLPADRAVYCESISAAVSFDTNMLTGVVTDKFKYIHTTRPELYNLIDDPDENMNRIEEQGHRGRILHDRLEQLVERSDKVNVEETAVNLDERSLAKLQSLGYVGASQKEDIEFDKSKGDPKDFIGVYNKYQNFLTRVHYDQTEQASKLAGEIIAEYPMLKEPNLFLAIQAMGAGEFDRAVSYLERLVKLQFELFKVHYNLGVAYTKLNRLDEAAVNYSKALEINPKALKVYNELAAVLQRKGNAEKALDYYKKSLEIDPKQPLTLGMTANVCSALNDHDNAVRYWNKALELQPNWTTALNNLAWIHISAEDTDFFDPARGVELAKKASEITENRNPLILDTLALAYSKQGNYNKAVEITEMAIAAVRDDAELTKKLKDKLGKYQKHLTADPVKTE